MQPAIEQLLPLVRLAVHKSPLPDTPIEWQSVFQLACKHNIAAILNPTVQQIIETNEFQRELLLNSETLSPGIVSTEWQLVADQTITRTGDQCRLLFHLAHLAEKEGIGILVLKGYDLAYNYPNPYLRYSNDIDVFPFELDNKNTQKRSPSQRLDDLVRKQFNTEIRGEGTDHHTSFTLGDLDIENHFMILGEGFSRTARNLEKQVQSLALGHKHPNTVQGSTVYLPGSRFDALYLLRHTAKHFVESCINLRHLLDWAFFVESPQFQQAKDEIWPWLIEESKRYNMNRFLAIINSICIEELGFPASHYPYLPCEKPLKERVLSAILYPKENDKDHTVDTPHLLKFKYWLQNQWKRRICTNVPLYSSFVHNLKTYVIIQRQYKK